MVVSVICPPVGDESSDIDVSEAEKKTVVPSTTESTAELLATSTPETGTSEPLNIEVSLSEASGSEVKVLSKAASNDNETHDLLDLVKTDAVNDIDTSEVHLTEDASDSESDTAPNDDTSA